MGTSGGKRVLVLKEKSEGEETGFASPRVEARCNCGNLLAKYTAETVEIKCRRCKRIKIFPVRDLEARYYKTTGMKRRCGGHDLTR